MSQFHFLDLASNHIIWSMYHDQQITLIHEIVCAHCLWMIKFVKENDYPDNTLFLQGVVDILPLIFWVPSEVLSSCLFIVIEEDESRLTKIFIWYFKHFFHKAYSVTFKNDYNVVLLRDRVVYSKVLIYGTLWNNLKRNWEAIKGIKVALMGDSNWLLKLSVQQVKPYLAWACMCQLTALCKQLSPAWLRRAASPCAWASLKREVEMRKMLSPPSMQQSCGNRVWISYWSKQGNCNYWQMLFPLSSCRCWAAQRCAVISVWAGSWSPMKPLNLTAVLRRQSLQAGNYACTSDNGFSCADKAATRSNVVNSE